MTNERVYRDAIARLEHGKEWLERCFRSPPNEPPVISLGTRDMDWLVATIALLKTAAVEPKEDQFTVMRPYPHTICNAASPLECERRPDGTCPKCSITVK